MTQKKEQGTELNGFTKSALLLLIIVVYAVSLSLFTTGVPTGASITSNSTDTGPSFSPNNRSDQGGTINTLVVDSIQQNPGWKAYVGNATGTLTLDDSNSNTIYDWSLSSITGEVYTSRDNTVDWANVSCASQTSVDTEQTFIGGASSDDDSINTTYNKSQHATMQVGVNAISNSTCKTTYTYKANASPAQGEAVDFTTILLEDTGSDLIYASFLEQDATAYDGASTYDFEIVVPDPDNGSIATYYFYLEIGS